MGKATIGLVVLVVASVGGWYLLHSGGPAPDPSPPGPPHGTVWFEDVAEAAGVDFRHFDPATPQHLITETMGSGVGWIDYDADGWPDLFHVQDGPLPPAPGDPSKTHKLYRNNRDGTFTDVTARVGLDKAGFGMGCAVGDYDNDGFDDLVVTYLGGVSLFHNVADRTAPGGRRFKDVTDAAKLSNPHWGTSCAWADLDGDGLLDLYLCNYVEIDPTNPFTCKDPAKGLPISCNPTAYPHVVHRLFRNTGDGSFTDVTQSSGVGSVTAEAGLGVVILDLDGDGKPDIYAVNDLGPAYLFHNLGGMRFEEVALPAGVALGPGGERMAGMGVEAADLDGSGRPSLFVTNFQRLPNVLFLNRGNLRFDDASYPSGLGGPSVDRLKFGVCALDSDLDGNVDLAVANGHVNRAARQASGVSYAQEAQLFLGNGAGKFRDASETAGADFLKPRVGRGLARADYDHDGLPDLVLSAVGEPAVLLHNRTTTHNGWVSLELVGDGKKSNRNAVGAVVRVEWGGKSRHHCVIGGGSYLSANDRRLLLGLGEAPKLDAVTVRWPSGKVQVFRDLPARTRWRLTEGVATAETVNLPGR
ncbi:MAG: repeat protein [Gemmataceae bacterium]|nr:repeat protein [Gemmataceae bacterium]